MSIYTFVFLKNQEKLLLLSSAFIDFASTGENEAFPFLPDSTSFFFSYIFPI